MILAGELLVPINLMVSSIQYSFATTKVLLYLIISDCLHTDSCKMSYLSPEGEVTSSWEKEISDEERKVKILLSSERMMLFLYWVDMHPTGIMDILSDNCCIIGNFWGQRGDKKVKNL